MRRALCVLDGLQRTIYVSGFSKILAFGWRVGFGGRAARSGRAAAQHQVARHADHACACWSGRWPGDRPAAAPAMPNASVRGLTRRGRAASLALAHGCTLPQSLQACLAGSKTGVDTDALAQRMLDDYLIAPGALFHAASSAPDADQLCDHARRRVLDGVCAAAGRDALTCAGSRRASKKNRFFYGAVTFAMRYAFKNMFLFCYI